MGKIGIFIDGANMFYAQRDNGWHIDYKKLYDYCKQKEDVVAASYYTASPYYKHTKEIEKHNRYTTALSYIGYTVIDKPLKIMKSKKKKGNLDIEMATDIMASLNLYDTCFFISGDGDFAIVVKHLRNCGKMTICIARKASTAFELRNGVNKFIDLDDIKDVIEKT